jgi:hypothetical protein
MGSISHRYSFFVGPCRPAVWVPTVFICLFLTGFAPAADPGMIFSLQAENDLFGGGTDRHFTHGTRLHCLTAPIHWISALADKLPWFDVEKAKDEPDATIQARAGISLGQSIFTPEDISRTDLIARERPYAGWLYVGFGLVASQGSNRYDQLELNLGVVGPSSLAEDVQKEWHHIFGLRRPNGWSHQLADEPAAVLFYEQARRFEPRNWLFKLKVDGIPHFGGALGNVFTYGAAGFTVRIGPDLHKDFGPPRIRPSLPGAGFFHKASGLSWYLFGGVEGRLVARNIFLDGNTFEESHSVDKKIAVGDIQAGAAIQYRRMRLTYTQTWRSKEYDSQDQADSFGAMSASYHF